MRKIRLNVADLDATEVLSRAQLKTVFGGSNSGSILPLKHAVVMIANGPIMALGVQEGNHVLTITLLLGVLAKRMLLNNYYGGFCQIQNPSITHFPYKQFVS